jgi:SulP family sulfate permease
MYEGLQNYMCYSNSVLYAKSGGIGKVSSLAISLFTIFLFIIGPSIANYLPRCMAGTLLLHMGIDLVLEGVYDCKLTNSLDHNTTPSQTCRSLFLSAFGNYDHFEYAGIWLITVVMTVWGMTAALIAGIIAALSTYAVQVRIFCSRSSS